ncbi:MAG TPA: hypothetical protein VK212_03140 [Lentimicrobium sp.]|nr:hypothetical protein [Lentimicrobium sp.]
MKIASFIKPAHFLLLPVICMITMMVACTEDEKIEPDYTKVYHVKKKSIESVSQGITAQQYYNYEYSENGKITKVTWDNPFGRDIYEYLYNGAASITIIHSSDYNSGDTTLLGLNGSGLVVSMDNQQQKRITRYRYDGQGYCVYSKYSEYGADTSDIVQVIETAEFTYIDGNLILEKRVYNENMQGSIQNYYYKDKINIAGNSNTGMDFFGKSSKNLLKTAAAVDEFDAEGRLTKRSEGETIYTYEYY